MKKCSTYLLLIFFCASHLFAQEVPRTLNFSKNDYQAHNQNWAIAQSRTGEIVIGNGAGLLIFDGAVWRTLSLPSQQVVRSVACDALGRIFVGGFAEFGYWERTGFEDYKYHSLSQNLNFEKAKREEIWHILISDVGFGISETSTVRNLKSDIRNEAVYFQSFSTLYKFDGKDVSVIKPPNNVMFLQSVGSRLILPVLNEGLFELTTDNQFLPLPNADFFKNKEVAAILPLGNTFVVGTKRDGIFIFENNQFRQWAVLPQRISTEFQLNKAAKLHDGRLVLGTILNGVFVFDSIGNLLFHLNKENGLQNNTTLALFEDRDFNLWLGLDKGIDLVDLQTPLTFFQDKTGKIGTVYTAAVFNQKLYVGTNQGVFWRPLVPNWKPLAGNEKWNFQLLKGSQGQVWDLQVIDNQLLCGHNNGTFRIDATQSFTQISSVTGGWQLIRANLSDASKAPDASNQNLLFQGTYTGIAVYKRDASGLWQFWKILTGFGQPTKKLAFDAVGNLWALTPYGQLFKLSLDAHLTAKVEIKATEQQGKFDMVRLDNQLIFNQNHQHFQFNYAKNDFELSVFQTGNFKIRQGVGDEILKIHPDAVEILRGSATIEKFRLRLIPNFETVIALDSNRYLFGFDDGYAIFDRHSQKKNDLILPYPILRLQTQQGEIFNFYPNFNENPSSTQLKLPPQYRNLTLYFALPFFTDVAQFSYFWVGQSADWTHLDAINRRDFSNLKSGKHQIRVRDNITQQETLIEFEISSHWYETFWAFWAYLLLIIGGIFWLNKYHNRQLEQQRQALEAEKLRALEEERIRSDNEKLHLDVLNKSTELANSAMGIVRKNEVLMDIRANVEKIKNETLSRSLDKNWEKVIGLIDQSVANDESHQIFEDNFNEVHQDFLLRLKQQFPSLTPGDLRLAAYLRMNLTSKEISPLLYISLRGVENKRYRLRKKLELYDDANLTDFLIRF